VPIDAFWGDFGPLQRLVEQIQGERCKVAQGLQDCIDIARVAEILEALISIIVVLRHVLLEQTRGHWTGKAGRVSDAQSGSAGHLAAAKLGHRPGLAYHRCEPIDRQVGRCRSEHADGFGGRLAHAVIVLASRRVLLVAHRCC